MRIIPEEEALAYHARGRKGKLEVVPTKPCTTQRDLSLAYTPGVARPCLKIAQDPAAVWEYTARGNLVAVVSNGSAVLGLGNIGALAAKPVMEGKAVLFKRFADIDVFDLELATEDPDEIVRAVRLLEPTFGGINLEDIRSPDCFLVEEELRRTMRIPVFHDDQHGTAIISGAALLNALEIAGKAIEDVRVVFCGAGAAGIACARYYLQLGVGRENLVLADEQGVVHRGRTGLHRWLADLAADTPHRTLREAVAGADVLVGLSAAGVVDGAMLRSMADRPIVFAMANPDPEISWEDARAARPDAILATGRSDYPNQVNNVLGFPFIFRGALDVRATTIDEGMKLAATRALAALAREDVPEPVMKAYGVERMQFGPDYLIPKPFDERVLVRVASEVARAAMASGVAQHPVDLDAYREALESRLGRRQEVMRVVVSQARYLRKRIVFPEGSDPKILRASQMIRDEGLGIPVLLGRTDEVEHAAADLEIDLTGLEVLDPRDSPLLPGYIDRLYEKRQRQGVTQAESRRLLRRNFMYFGAMMVDAGDADALVAGVSQHYPDTLRPALQVIGTRDGVSRVSGVYMMIWRDRILFLGDTTVNIEPTAEELAETAVLSAEVARRFLVEPRVAMISFSNFGSVPHPAAEKVRRAVDEVRRREPGLVVDGEVQADMAVTPELMREHFPFSRLRDGATVLVFSGLASANASYKLLSRLGGAEAVGPILMGMRKPVHVLQHGADVRDIVHMAAIAAVDAS